MGMPDGERVEHVVMVVELSGARRKDRIDARQDEQRAERHAPLGGSRAGAARRSQGQGGDCRCGGGPRDSAAMRRLPLVLALLAAPTALAAQTWNADSALALVGRAIARRPRAAADTSLHDYKAQAHGFVFFLGQFGEGLIEPPRLIKADQLELEVYWKAPGASKQRIVGGRDRAELPTDINYHRDHLGIVQNNFGPLIPLGEGYEVRDVPHPLSPGAEQVRAVVKLVEIGPA